MFSVWFAQLWEGKLKLLMRWKLISRWEQQRFLVQNKSKLWFIYELKGNEKIANLIFCFYCQNLSRGLVNIATKLTNTKDVRDFFIDLVEKVSALFETFYLQLIEVKICRIATASLRLFCNLIPHSCPPHSLLSRVVQTDGAPPT